MLSLHRGRWAGLLAALFASFVFSQETCLTCHGPDGNSPNPAFPKLNGQHPSYLIKTLTEYKSGERKDPVMAGMAAALSKEDIENVAAYFAGQSGLKTKY